MAIALLVAHLVIVALALLLLLTEQPVDLNPARDGGSGTGAACAIVPTHDDLVHMALRSPDRASLQAARWIACEPSRLERARDALRWDHALIATVTIGVGLATLRGLRRSRWQWSAVFTLGFLAVYLACDLAENRLLNQSLDGLVKLGDPLANLDDAADAWSPWLRWVAGVKLGALLATLPMFFVSLAIAFGDVFGERTIAPSVAGVTPDRVDDDGTGTPTPLRYVGGVARTEAREPRRRPDEASSTAPQRRPLVTAIFQEPDDRRLPPRLPEPLTFATSPGDASTSQPEVDAKAPEPIPPPTMAVACSGGGIRSAAFNLGALQALDTARAQPDAPTEWQRVRRISAVSGGSYIAAAWVSARAGAGVDADRRWSRGSREESHLRRHSSYIAPGFAGKFWAGMRFLLGLLINVGIIVLALAAFALPYGWFVGAVQEPVPASGGAKIRFEDGDARIRLASGRTLAPVENGTIRLASGATVHLAADESIVLPVTSATESSSETTTQSKTTTTGPTGASTTEAESTSRSTSETSTEADGAGGTIETTTTEETTTEATPDTTTEKRTATREQTTTQTADADTDPRDVALAVELDAATDGRTLPKGTQVVIDVARHPVEVDGRVYGCILAVGDSPGSATPCEVRSLVVGDHATLVRTGRAVLTTDDESVVDRGALIAACGAHACERVGDRFHTDWVWVLLGIAVAIGMITVAARPRERLAATHQRVFRIATTLAFGAIVFFFVLPTLVSWAEGQRWSIEERSRLAGVSVLTVLVAMISQLVPLLGSGTTPSGVGRVTGWFGRVGSSLKPWLIRLAAYVAAPIILLAIVLFFASFAAQREIEPGQVAMWLALVGALLVIGAGADLNQWSLHPYYRERLISAFGVDPTTLAPRDPSVLCELPPDTGPELVICAAANVDDERVTAPGRPVVPWTFSRDAIGAPGLEAVFGDPPQANVTVPARAFTGKLTPLQSLWTAVAVSGAAFSPSMGKMTRAERGLMALGNIRLGIWYPNPAKLDARPTWYQAHHPTPVCLAKEAFGRHKATDRWVYVTDGGHYENLGLVELLRRYENEIYCFDASGDSTDTFGTMAEAMRLAREEHEIEIHFDPSPLSSAPTSQDAKDGISPFGATAAWLTCREEDGGRRTYGWLVFAKLAVPAKAPFDIVDLARTLPKFPNHPTTDQLYTDQKFEAYRALGYYVGTQAALIAQCIRRRVEAGDTIEHAVRVANHEYAGGPDPDPKPPGSG